MSLRPALAVSRAPRVRRVSRSPRHEFQGGTYPFSIQPIAILPVLPNETLTALKLEARIKTDPLISPFIGWWTEVHVFYVKHRDLDAHNGNTYFQDMVLQPDTDISSTLGTVSGSAGPTYRIHGKPDFTKECLDCVVDWWFRDEGEVAGDFVNPYTNLPIARNGRSDWMDSLVDRDQFNDPDFPVDIDNSGTITARDIDVSMQQYMQLLQTGALVNMTYEDWLSTYGVRQPRVAVNKPELIRSFKQWTQPTNTVTQTTGTVTSACVWTLNENLLTQKQYFFKEPGFILALSVTKPKMYRGKQTGAAVNMLTNAPSWLPATMREDQTISLIAFDSVSGPVANSVVSVMGSTGAMFDSRDLFVHGDQFLFAAPSVAGGDSVAGAGAYSVPAGGGHATFMAFEDSPDSNGRPDYNTGSGTSAWGSYFVATTPAATQIRMEGYLRPTISGQVTDLTPGVPVR